MPLPYPPPYQSLATLAEHVCMGESTIELHVRQGIFPPHTKVQGGKKFWSWKKVVKHFEGDAEDVPLSPAQQLEGVSRTQSPRYTISTEQPTNGSGKSGD